MKDEEMYTCCHRSMYFKVEGDPSLNDFGFVFWLHIKVFRSLLICDGVVFVMVLYL